MIQFMVWIMYAMPRYEPHGNNVGNKLIEDVCWYSAPLYMVQNIFSDLVNFLQESMYKLLGLQTSQYKVQVCVASQCRRMHFKGIS